MRETRGRHRVVVDDVLVPGDVLNGGHALRRCGVRKHHLAVCIANAVEVVDDLAALVEDLHLFVYGHEASLQLDPERLQVERLGVGCAARGDHRRVDLERIHGLLRLCVDHFDYHGLLSELPRRHLGRENVRVVVDGARVDEEARREALDLGVETGHDVGHGLHKGDVGSQCRIHVGELQADVAAANDGHPLRHVLELESLVRGEHRLAVDCDPRRDKWHRSGRKDDVLRTVRLAVAALDLLGLEHRRLGVDDIDAERLERVAHVLLDP
mmetsp:Transcript_9751/g.29630  ORF Transcript_9751/g.29630 Transcript_9751/m.29630 type:complete len:269 (+) Transcript_9751:688-1494(+)